MKLSRHPIKLEEQVATFAELGLTLNAGIEERDLYLLGPKADLEHDPYRLLVEVMAMETERKPHQRIADRVKLFGYYAVDGSGVYRKMLLALERMTGKALSLTDIDDHVDIENSTGWVQFQHAGETVRWDLFVHENGIDVGVFHKYDQRLEMAGSKRRLYIEYVSFDPSAFLVLLDPNDVGRFTDLTSIEVMEPEP